MEYLEWKDSDVEQMSSAQRRQFFPRLSGIRPAAVIGSQNTDGLTNASLFNSLSHIGSKPPLLGLIFRPLTVERHTYNNLKATGYYTINLVSSDDRVMAHQVSAKYDNEVSEFDANNITPVYIDGIEAPFWPNAPIQFGLQFEEEYEIKANQTVLVIGKVNIIRVQSKLIDADGLATLELANILHVNGLESYYGTQFLEKLPYPRP